MKIHSSSTNPVSQITQVQGADSPEPAPASKPAVGTSAAQFSLSGPGQLISKLMQLKQQDPDKFKQVVSGLAASLKSAAAEQSGRAADRLTQLANKLDDVAAGGEIGQLRLHDDFGHHRHHHHMGGVKAGDGEQDGNHDSVPPPASSSPTGAVKQYAGQAEGGAREAVRSAFGSLLQQLDAALAGTASAPTTTPAATATPAAPAPATPTV